MIRIFIIVSLWLIISCKKDKPFTNTGVINGPDVRMCACCGGLFFHFTDIGDTSNRPLFNPGIFQFPSDIKFPVKVAIDWQPVSDNCGGIIKIMRYKLL